MPWRRILQDRTANVSEFSKATSDFRMQSSPKVADWMGFELASHTLTIRFINSFCCLLRIAWTLKAFAASCTFFPHLRRVAILASPAQPSKSDYVMKQSLFLSPSFVLTFFWRNSQATVYGWRLSLPEYVLLSLAISIFTEEMSNVELVTFGRLSVLRCSGNRYTFVTIIATCSFWSWRAFSAHFFDRMNAHLFFFSFETTN